VVVMDLVVLDPITYKDRWFFLGIQIRTVTVAGFLPDTEGLQIFTTEKRLHGKLEPIGFREYMPD